MASINGFVVRSSPRAIPVRSYTVPGTKVSLPVRVDVAPLLIGFAAEFHRSVEPLTRGWNWGYAYRAVRGASSPSFHAAGIAIDLNAPGHPLGRRGTFSAQQIRTIRALCRKYGLRWGGDYRRRPDEMHFEVILPIAAALARVRALQAKPVRYPTPVRATVAKVVAAVTRKPVNISPVLRLGSSGRSVKGIQNALRVAGYAVAVDGQFGPGTKRALVAFQAKRRLTADGVVGPKTWVALRKVVHG